MKIVIPKNVKEKKIEIEITPSELVVIKSILIMHRGVCIDPKCACQDIFNHVRDTVIEATDYCWKKFEQEITDGFKK